MGAKTDLVKRALLMGAVTLGMMNGGDLTPDSWKAKAAEGEKVGKGHDSGGCGEGGCGEKKKKKKKKKKGHGAEGGCGENGCGEASCGSKKKK